MPEIVSTIIGLCTGLLAGLVTGFYFERRSSKSVRAHNAELNRQLSVLRTTLYSMGAPRGEIQQRADRRDADLTSRVTARALATQDAGGRVRGQALVAYFVEKGERAADIENALRSLCNVGRARQEGEWLRMS